MIDCNWIVIDVDSQTVVLTIKAPRDALIRRLNDEFPEGRYEVMRVKAVELFEVTVPVRRQAQPITRNPS